MQINPRRHYWPVIRAHALLGAALKAILDHLHPTNGDDDPVEPPPQVIVAAEVHADGQPVPAGSVVVVQQPGMLNEVPSQPMVEGSSS